MNSDVVNIELMSPVPCTWPHFLKSSLHCSAGFWLPPLFAVATWRRPMASLRPGIARTRNKSFYLVHCCNKFPKAWSEFAKDFKGDALFQIHFIFSRLCLTWVPARYWPGKVHHELEVASCIVHYWWLMTPLTRQATNGYKCDFV